MSIEADPKITVNYGGNYANKISWNENNLAKFALVSRLKTKVEICAGDDKPKFSSTNLGEVLAWRNLGNSLDIFGHHTSLGEKARIVTDLENGKSKICLNDQIITADVVRRCKGRVDERMFVSQVNTLVNKGLSNVLAQEKRRQLLTSIMVSGGFLGINAIAAGFFAGLAYSFITLKPFSHFSRIPEMPITDYLMALTIILRGVIFHLDSLRRFISIEKQVNLNPIGHMKHFLEGQVFLSKEGKDLASYTE